jgi:hypothetical protein
MPPSPSLVFADDFDDPTLDTSRWIPAYLPQWSSWERSRPRYRLRDGCLVLAIEPDQRPWCPEFNGPVRVSGLQTGVFSGPIGSPIGQHHFAPGLTVREAQVPRRTFTPQYGRIEVRARCLVGPGNVAALWLIGYEEHPEESAELCVFELKGSAVDETGAVVGYGIHPFADPSLTEDFHETRIDQDIGDFHVYSADWRPDGVTFALDGRPLGTVAQSPAYPMQLMLNIYDLEPAATHAHGVMELWVDYVRVWQ